MFRTGQFQKKKNFTYIPTHTTMFSIYVSIMTTTKLSSYLNFSRAIENSI